jgi:molybdopterin synthase sulfur carrier subunit
MKVKVLFFGVLSELAGASVKFYDDVKSSDQLNQRVYDDFPEMVHYKYKISVNNELISKDTLLKNGDEVAFLPPFAGG